MWPFSVSCALEKPLIWRETAFSLALARKQQPGSHSCWARSEATGEHSWAKHYPYCGGAFQSPINIKPELLRFDPTLRPVEVQNYNLSPNEQLTLGNNGHSVQISLPSKMYISGLPHRYTAAQLHFHWGSSGRPAGSEHMVNGRQYAAEMHVVHYNSDKYPNMSTAVDKSDGLAVLGVLIEVRRGGQWGRVTYQRVQVPGFNIRALLPARLDEYYRYDGSLTTPPCYPSVLWTVFRNHVTISGKQVLCQQFRPSFKTQQISRPSDILRVCSP
uniref:Carbonic anhydrase n=1 Tax=Sparus aurata TaxID=8175 RepID=A0A671UP19_SPAAU